MRQWISKETEKDIGNSLDYACLINTIDHLRLAFRISQDNRYQVLKIWIDEPCGMDSDWKHYQYKGEFLQSIEEDEFVQKYQDLDLEWVTLKGNIENTDVKYYIGEKLIKVFYPTDTPKDIANTALEIAEEQLKAIERRNYENLTDEECLELLQDEVEKRMEELDLFVKDDAGNFKLDVDGDRCVKLGACHTIWSIEKRLMKERFGRDWQSPADEYPDILFD